ncbi:MAG TPA: amino acid permease [Caulobacteraceae bacterium]|jgi:APA family basic amino acid/polyamine antiporter|nr:amino acid permease [Caulobacteraceae bacterium]
MNFATRRKSIDAMASAHHGRNLKPSLGWPHLVALGVGAIVGTGIYTLTGVSAGLAGPGVIFSFAIAGAVCACAALAYAEMATMIPETGSAYTYSYSALGEIFAWVVGCSLMLEYTLVCGTVSVGWSAYLSGVVVSQLGVHIPHALLAGPLAGGVINLPAVLVALGVAGVLLLGARESATINFVLVLIKLIALAAFVALTLPAFKASHFQPLMPFGFTAHVGADGVKRGVMAAAAIIFFAFYGFDAISTAAEEARNPARDLTIGIVGSMLLCTLIYMVVAACALGASPYTTFSRSGEPLAFILRSLDHPLAASLIAGAAILALPTVIMVFMYGQSRVFFAMARDGLLPSVLSRVNRRGVPALVTMFTGVVAATVAGLAPLDLLAAAANAGTLLAFISTALCMMVLRRRDPARQRPFRTPLPWLVGPAAILGCLYLFSSLPLTAVVVFFSWNALGLVVYLLYGRTSSQLARG